MRKACLNPARMLGVESKGHLGPGADADIAVVDPATFTARWVVARGRIIVEEGVVVGQGGTLLTTPAGREAALQQGIPVQVAAPGWI